MVALWWKIFPKLVTLTCVTGANTWWRKNNNVASVPGVFSCNWYYFSGRKKTRALAWWCQSKNRTSKYFGYSTAHNSAEVPHPLSLIVGTSRLTPKDRGCGGWKFCSFSFGVRPSSIKFDLKTRPGGLIYGYFLFITGYRSFKIFSFGQTFFSENLLNEGELVRCLRNSHHDCQTTCLFPFFYSDDMYVGSCVMRFVGFGPLLVIVVVVVHPLPSAFL